MTFHSRKHHRRSIRLPEYNYTQPGAYFITICTYQRQCWFGEVVDGKMRLNRVGEIVSQFWQSLPRRFNNIRLDTFVVMPNHLHGILMITETHSTHQNSPQVEKFGKPVSGSIPTIVRSFKSAVTSRINVMRRNVEIPIWQRNYYESIIRTENDLAKVRQYIIDNPYQWELDKDNPNNNLATDAIELDLYF